jgi:dihydrofolate reductase
VSSASITLIAAMSRNRVIGRDGSLPWRIPADMQRFKRRTTDHAVIMGRRTWESMKGPLPERANIVVTRDKTFRAEGAIAVHSLDDAVRVALEQKPLADEIFIIGGAEIYRLALPRADRIDLTVIDVEIADGDAFFPEFESDIAWRLVSEQRHAADDRNLFAFKFCEFRRANETNV